MAITFTVPQTELARAAQTVNQAVPVRSTLPALMNMHLEVEDGHLRLTATDLDTSVTLQLPCDEGKKGKTLVPASLFTDLVKNLPPDVVSVKSEGESLKIISKGGEFSLPTADPDDYPQLPRLEQERKMELASSTFAELVSKVGGLASTEDNRPDLNGVLTEFRGDELRMVATNGHLMGVAGAKGVFPKGDSVVVLPSALRYAASGLRQADKLELGIARTQIVFQVGNVTVFSRLLETSFPKYEDVIPSNNKKKLVIRKDELQQGLRRVDVVADNITHQVRFKIEKGLLQLEAQQTVGGGRAQVKVEAQYDDDPLEVGFNAKYVLEILKTFDAEEIEMAFDTPLAATIVKPSPEPADGRHLCLVMPLRLPS